METELVYTVPEAAHLLKVSEWTVYNLLRSGALPCVPVGKRGKRVPRDALLAYAAGRLLSDIA